MTTKVHAAVDRRGRLLRLVATPGQRGDAPQAGRLLGGFARGRVGHAAADAADDRDAIRRRAKRMGATACIRPNPTREARKRYDRRRYRNRNAGERLFGRVERYRRVTTRYDKKAVNFAGSVWLAAMMGELG